MYQRNTQNHRTVKQKYKLAMLTQCFEVNPHSDYRVTVRGGVAQAVIDEDNTNDHQLENEEESQQFNYDYEEKTSKKEFGLFANLIKNMQVKKQTDLRSNQNKKGEKPRQYTYYFDVFKRKERSSEDSQLHQLNAEEQENHFGNIQIQEECKQDQSNSNKENISKAEHFVDLNFSFDEISKHMQQIKNGASYDRNSEGDTIVNKIYKQSFAADGEVEKVAEVKSSKTQKNMEREPTQKRSIKQIGKLQSINFAQLSKELKYNQSDAFLPIPQRDGNSLPHQSNTLLGTKKVQSRIIANDAKKEGSINIDFDLDINFI